jgi:hypothetical protein
MKILKKNMKKQIRELLNNNQQIIIKWKNMSSWTTSFKGNCYELIKSENIKITRKGDDQLKLIYSLGCHKIVSITNLYCLEREVLNLVAMKNQYLGDRSSILSRFGTRNINY